MATLKEKLGYALGDAAAGGITWKVMSIAFPFFFTNVFGLTFADTATLMLIARLFDVVTDPLMGSLADRTRSRWGTYRPWLILGSIPYGLIFALLLFTPELDPVGKRIWAYSLYLLMMAVYTAVNVPYGSLLGVMTDDGNERNQFSSYRMVGAYAMGFITLGIFPYIQKWIGGTEQHQYAMIGVIFGILAAVMTLACGLLTKERIITPRPTTDLKKYLLYLFGCIIAVAIVALIVYYLSYYSFIIIGPLAVFGLYRFYRYNTPWFYITFIAICTNFFNGFRYAVAAYMFTYCLNGDVSIGSFIINYTVFMAIGEATCMIFGGVSPAFTKWIGSKRMAFIWASVICAATSFLYYFIPMDASYIWMMIVVSILTSVGAGLYSPLLWSMYADVADYATEKNGTSSTGLIFSSGTMAQKLGGAISGALIALLLGAAGLVSDTDPVTNETIVTITDEASVKQMIWCLFSVFPGIIALLMVGLTWIFPLKK